jgi:hypothetical protein
LQVLALSGLLAATTASFQDVLLALSTVVALVFARDRLTKAQFRGVYLASYVCSGLVALLIFRLSPTGSGSTPFFAAKVVLLVVVSLCVWSVAASHNSCSEKVRWPVVIGLALASINFANVYLLDLNNEFDGFTKWSGSYFWLILSLAFFLSSKLFHSSILRPWLLRFISTYAIMLAVVGGIGVVRIGEAIYQYAGAKEYFSQGDVIAGKQSMQSVLESAESLDLKAEGLEWILSGLAKEVFAKGASESMLAFGDFAVEHRAWTWALKAYKRADVVYPNVPTIRAQYSRALFESGSPLAAIDTLATIDQSSIDGVVLTYRTLFHLKTRNWPAVVDDSPGLYAHWSKGVLLAEGEDYLYANIGDVVSGSLWAEFANYLTLFDVARIVAANGGRVFYENMEIGSTGIKSPIDIETYSGGGGTWKQEEIILNGKRVSPKGRGYNIVVINPQTGELEDAVAFDTWENKAEGFRLYDYLRHVPYGKIVVGTVRDDGMSGLLEKTKVEFGKLGVKYSPPYWGSHSFIGVKGAINQLIPEAFGNQDNPVALGVLGGRKPDVDPRDEAKLKMFLRREAAEALGKFAVYISGIKAKDVIAVARF